MKKLLIAAGSLIAVCIFCLAVWYGFWVNFVENYELGFTFDKRTGKIERLEHTGWVIVTPWFVDVHKVDLRPSQVCMNANLRVLNCKLVQFNPKGLQTFVDWHGRAAGDYSGNLYEILRSYAFNVNGGTDCPFLMVLEEIKKSDGDPVAQVPQGGPGQ